MKISIFRYSDFHPVIKEFREIRADADDPVLTHFVPPMGYPEIIFYVGKQHQIKNTEARRGLVKGQFNIPQKIDFIPGYHFVSIVLHPYGLKQLLNIAGDTLVNGILDIEDIALTSQMMRLLVEKQAVDMELIIQMEHLMRQFGWQTISETTQHFVKLVETSSENTLHLLLKKEGVGLRTLQRKFKQEVGLTPKEYLRIRRMNKVESAISGHVHPLQIVADFDFADHAHLIKECKQLRAFTPGELVSKKLLLSDQLPPPDFIPL